MGCASIPAAKVFTADGLVRDLTSDLDTILAVIDAYSAMTIEFLDFADPPAIVDLGQRIADQAAYKTIVAMSRDDLVNALGSELAATAAPIAWDPVGQPVAWAVTP